MTKIASAVTPDGGKTRRIYMVLRDEILGGTLVPGAPLPGELKLAERHGVSRVTIRRALDALVSDGLVERRPGSGTIVKRPQSRPVQIRADFATLMPHIRQMGEETTARLLSFSYGVPPAHVAEALRLAEGARAQRAVRLRLAQGLPFSYLTTFVPEEIAQGYSEADLATTPLFRLLEESGVRVDHAHQSVSAVLATPEIATALETEVGAALISLTRVVYDRDGRGIEYLSALYRPDRYQLELTLTRDDRGDTPRWQPVAAGGGSEAA
ncbi:GntR family transcriptional regulator [Tepidamorphus gemmatus]|uniref:GntR family transcriptional regulator n=1 Tax=Tepidamorphus gemmatus TaxID=747076 RepID=A0A4R3MDE3_9HYPH|nr:GntR family transcriptional regulator [Tepidamorphus gemmatus]TCT11571.1 GntR family transcriptional regulator [Tepidamorphus gemmatus]